MNFEDVRTKDRAFLVTHGVHGDAELNSTMSNALLRGWTVIFKLKTTSYMFDCGIEPAASVITAEDLFS